MFEITIKYTGDDGLIHFVTYSIKTKDINAAKNKAIMAAGRNRLKNASIHSFITVY